VEDVDRSPRRVIGDDSNPDREIEGINTEKLLELYRDMVLLRTFDDRAVVYQRQGRIGTYAIYWGHEAIQAGGHFALDVSLVQGVGDRAAARDESGDGVGVVAGSPGWVVEPA